MIKFEFESHDFTPQDQYVKEVVVFKFTADNESWYVPYFHKSTKEGGSFWSAASAGVQVDGKKKYFDGFELDSRHRQKQILEFLNDRKWEARAPLAQPAIHYPHGLTQPAPAPTSMSEVVTDEVLPF
jgi:hypothetical protein